MDLSVFHQANRYILAYLRKETKIPEEKVYVGMLYSGSTASSSIAIALKQAVTEGSLQNGASVVIVRLRSRLFLIGGAGPFVG